MLIEPPLTFFKHDKITDEITTVPVQNESWITLEQNFSTQINNGILKVAEILKNNTFDDYYITLGTADDIDSFTLMKKDEADEFDKEILIGEMIYTGHELKKLRATKLGKKIYNFNNTPCLSIMEIWRPEKTMTEKEKKEYEKNINMITDMVLVLLSKQNRKKVKI